MTRVGNEFAEYSHDVKQRNSIWNWPLILFFTCVCVFTTSHNESMGCGKSVGRIVPYRIARASQRNPTQADCRWPSAAKTPSTVFYSLDSFSLYFSLFFSSSDWPWNMRLRFGRCWPRCWTGKSGGTIRYSEYDTHQLQGGVCSGGITFT